MKKNNIKTSTWQSETKVSLELFDEALHDVLSSSSMDRGKRGGEGDRELQRKGAGL